MEYEVFRIKPEADSCYEHANYNSVEEYTNANEPGRIFKKYFSDTVPVYVGRFIRDEGDPRRLGHSSIFKNDKGKEVRVMYTEEGTTCFRKVDCRAGHGGRRRRKTKKHRRKRKTKKRHRTKQRRKTRHRTKRRVKKHRKRKTRRR